MGIPHTHSVTTVPGYKRGCPLLSVVEDRGIYAGLRGARQNLARSGLTIVWSPGGAMRKIITLIRAHGLA